MHILCHHYHYLYTWATEGIGKRGHLPLRNVVKCFVHYQLQLFWRVGVVH